jgi:copper chaperone CopZ
VHDLIEFVVENAGCASCAARVRGALEPVALVHDIEVDEPADIATVRMEVRPEVDQDAVDQVLRQASEGAGHAYRVRPGSWCSPRAELRAGSA